MRQKEKLKMEVQPEREGPRIAERRAYQIFIPNCCVR
jgi:hypothetical protein